jgi:hypothetical protein
MHVYLAPYAELVAASVDSKASTIHFLEFKPILMLLQTHNHSSPQVLIVHLCLLSPDPLCCTRVILKKKNKEAARLPQSSDSAAFD